MEMLGLLSYWPAFCLFLLFELLSLIPLGTCCCCGLLGVLACLKVYVYLFIYIYIIKCIHVSRIKYCHSSIVLFLHCFPLCLYCKGAHLLPQQAAGGLRHGGRQRVPHGGGRLRLHLLLQLLRDLTRGAAPGDGCRREPRGDGAAAAAAGAGATGGLAH